MTADGEAVPKTFENVGAGAKIAVGTNGRSLHRRLRFTKEAENPFQPNAFASSKVPSRILG